MNELITETSLPSLENFTEDGFKSIVKNFERNKLTVIEIEIKKRPERYEGKLLKKVLFYFDDSQKLEIGISYEGKDPKTASRTIETAKLNSKPVPTSNLGDNDLKVGKVIDKLSRYIKQQSERFRNKLLKNANKVLDKKVGRKSADGSRLSRSAMVKKFSELNRDKNESLKELESQEKKLIEEEEGLDSLLSEQNQEISSLKEGVI